MATSADSTATLSTLLYSYIDQRLLERLEASLELEQFAEKRDIPMKMGKTIQWKKFTNFAATTALADEGENPSISNLSAASVSATVETFGSYVKISDMLELTAISPFLDGAIDALAYQAKLTIDTRIRDGLYNTSSIPTGAAGGFPLHYPASTYAALSTVAATYNPTLSSIKEVVFKLRKNNAPTFEDGYYVAVLHTAQVEQLMDDSTWATWNAPQHAKETMWKGEVGRAHKCRIVDSTNIMYTTSGTATPGTVSAYFGLVFGKSSYAVSRLGGKGMMETYIKRPDSSSTDNPINMFSTLGWKSRFATHVLDTSRGYVMVTGD